MIIFEEETITKEQLIEATKDCFGIRYRTKKDGSFEAYANVWTAAVDSFKYIKTTLVNKFGKLSQNL